MNFENNIQLNNGIYTIPEVSKILRLPYQRVSFWTSKYWDSKLGKIFEGQYSWTLNNSKAVSFHTLIEFFVFYQMAEAGVRPREVLNSHIELSKIFQTPFPFAQKDILENIRTTGKKVFFETKEGILSLDGLKQFKLDFIRVFFKNLEFDNELVASRFWPLGREKSILVDPRRQFGHPVLGSTNIYPETIYNLIKSGEPVDFIAFTYEIDKKCIEDAIIYCEAA
jgi:uncharacterized protein (DUF433 family)